MEINDERREIARLILEVLPLTMRVLAAKMRDARHSLSTAHLPVLAALEHKPYTQRELAEMMSVSGATMSNTLTTLEERGWIARERSKEDRRLILIEITKGGHTILRESLEDMEIQIQQLLVDLDERQHEELKQGLVILQSIFARALVDITQAKDG
ncbi:MAG: MarR family transcriptional regulator [Anaerolineae bacterium]|nr:MarR family transcriptional regulator [Anaerolineae bacterium]